jgi:transposase InsO family protein
MDVCKIRPGFYQYTAIDDCTRYRVLRLYSRQIARNTIEFIDEDIDEMHFPIQRFQTDRGREFFAYAVQERLMELSIKFRPIKPASPHLNGKVERSQQTDLQEFYPTVRLEDISLDEANAELANWQHYYNWDRPHGALSGRSPMDKVFDLLGRVPFWDDVYDEYEKGVERIGEQNYQLDIRLEKLKARL